MAGKAPRGMIGNRKVTAAKIRIEKEERFLGSLRAYTLNEGVAEVLAGNKNKEGAFTIPNVLKAINQAKSLVKEPGKENMIFFRDPKGSPVTLLQIVNSQKVKLQCENTVRNLSKLQK